MVVAFGSGSAAQSVCPEGRTVTVFRLLVHVPTLPNRRHAVVTGTLRSVNPSMRGCPTGARKRCTPRVRGFWSRNSRTVCATYASASSRRVSAPTGRARVDTAHLGAQGAGAGAESRCSPWCLRAVDLRPRIALPPAASEAPRRPRSPSLLTLRTHCYHAAPATVAMPETADGSSTANPTSRPGKCTRGWNQTRSPERFSPLSTSRPPTCKESVDNYMAKGYSYSRSATPRWWRSRTASPRSKAGPAPPASQPAWPRPAP